MIPSVAALVQLVVTGNLPGLRLDAANNDLRLALHTVSIHVTTLHWPEHANAVSSTASCLTAYSRSVLALGIDLCLSMSNRLITNDPFKQISASVRDSSRSVEQTVTPRVGTNVNARLEHAQEVEEKHNDDNRDYGTDPDIHLASSAFDLKQSLPSHAANSASLSPCSACQPRSQ
jgi:hypothetical protein